MNNVVDIELPKKMSMTHHADYIEIVRKWFGSQIIILTIFAVIWDSTMYAMYTSMEPDTELIEKLFPLIHVAVGIGITYYAIAGWFNKTHIFVSKEAIEIQHSPIPWIGNKRLQTVDIKQLYCKENISQNRRSTSITYEIHVSSNDGTNTKLLSGLETSEQSLFIEQEVEKYLGIENKPVRGEL